MPSWLSSTSLEEHLLSRQDGEPEHWHHLLLETHGITCWPYNFCYWDVPGLLSTSKRFWHPGFKVQPMHDTMLI